MPKIIIPSKKRTGNINAVVSLLGDDVTFFVHESEKDDYESFGVNVETHNHVGKMSLIRNEIIRRHAADIVCMCDDDITGVINLTEDKPQKITDRDHIIDIINNGFRICEDSGCAIFGWTRLAKPLGFVPHNPFHLNQATAQIFICSDPDLLCDEKLTAVEDIDLMLSCLLKRRYIITDQRYYFDFGAVWKGAGGCKTIRTEEREIQERQYLKRKWKSHICLDSKEGKKTGFSMAIRVKRKCQLSDHN